MSYQFIHIEDYSRTIAKKKKNDGKEKYNKETKLLSPMYGANTGGGGGLSAGILLSPMYGANNVTTVSCSAKLLLSPMYGAN